MSLSEEMFEVGDTVYLKSGGFPMSVAKIEGPDLVTLIYGKSQELRWATVDKAVLSHTKPRPKWEDRDKQVNDRT